MAEQVCRRFSLAEMQSATGDFCDARVIGRGGFGKVYKGLLEDDTLTVAVKRLASNSSQGEQEFAMEMETLSKLRHRNLVSLIGFCNEEAEMILVYEFMPNGTLADHLHKNNHNLTWNQRLRICIGAGRALDYLHTGSSVIHRDFKPANILLDENFTAKVSDFGLPKDLSVDDLESHVIASVKGSFGYIDPSYFISGRLTKASDTYAFGVVLLEVLSGRQAVDGKLGLCLTMWAQEKIRKGKFHEIVDPTLRAEISGDCLKNILGVVRRCLHHEPKKRLSMTEAVAQLVIALEQPDRKGSTRKFQFPSFNRFWNRGKSSGIGSTETDNNEAECNISPQDSLQQQQQQSLSPNKLGSQDSLQCKINCMQPQYTLLQREFYDRKSIDTRAIELPEIMKITDNFSDKRLISYGITGGTTLRGFLETGMEVAIKRRYKNLPDEEFLAQVSLSSKLKHKNVMELRGYCVDGGQQVLVYEFSERGSLRDILHGRQGPMVLPMKPVYMFNMYTWSTSSKPGVLSWRERIEIAIGVAKGLLYFHKNSLFHGNIKSSNILPFHYGITKICDPLVSTKCPCERNRNHPPEHVRDCGNHPPEYEVSGLSQEGDVYNFGILLLELLTGRKSSDLRKKMPEFDESNLHDIADPRLEGDYFLDEVEMMVKIAKRCVKPRAASRPKMNDIPFQMAASITFL